MHDRQFIDWVKTGVQLQLLRQHNMSLIRYVCRELKRDKENCKYGCDKCVYQMDKHISRKELAEVFGQTESVIFNWENGKTPVPLDEMLFYAQMSGKNIYDLLVFISRDPN